jgi:cation-transporting P-type ATPase D
MKTIYKLSTSLPSNETDIMNIIRQKTALKSLSDYGDFYKKICTYVLDTTSKLSINKSDLTKITVSSEDNNELSEHKEKAIKRFACKNPVYESCKMLAPDGQQLCFCDSKKMNWYVSRNLAKVISTNPPVFKLLFEPNARGCTDENGENSNFYITERKNCCVICGSTKEYRRFHVVPLLYRQFFPVNLKSHKSHDVLLVCYLCHEKANEVYEIKKEEISKRYNVPLNIKTNEQTLTHTINTFCKKCKSLYKNWDKLPYEKREKLRSEIFNEYSNIINEYKDNEFVLKLKERGYIDKIKDENGIDLDFAVYAMNYKGKKLESIEKKSVHGKLVVEQISNLKDFIREWRKYFVDSFHPKYLSSEWSVDHEMVRTFGEHSNFHKESNSK